MHPALERHRPLGEARERGSARRGHPCPCAVHLRHHRLRAGVRRGVARRRRVCAGRAGIRGRRPGDRLDRLDACAADADAVALPCLDRRAAAAVADRVELRAAEEHVERRTLPVAREANAGARLDLGHPDRRRDLHPGPARLDLGLSGLDREAPPARATPQEAHGRLLSELEVTADEEMDRRGGARPGTERVAEPELRARGDGVPALRLRDPLARGRALEHRELGHGGLVRPAALAPGEEREPEDERARDDDDAEREDSREDSPLHDRPHRACLRSSTLRRMTASRSTLTCRFWSA